MCMQLLDLQTYSRIQVSHIPVLFCFVLDSFPMQVIAEYGVEFPVLQNIDYQLSIFYIVVCLCQSPHDLTLCDPIDCSSLGSSVYRIFQARILEWVAISIFRASSQPRGRTHNSCIYLRCQVGFFFFFLPLVPHFYPLLPLAPLMLW